MIFLNPAILFGLIAASFPILIHLFNVRKVKDVEFSTLMFLKEIKKSKIKKIKLKQWLLLILRTLLIILLVMAFARPTLETVTISGNSVTKSSVCFLIDDSFSMQLRDDKGTAFNQIKKTVKQIINSLQDNDDISVLTFSGKEIFAGVGKKEIIELLDQIKLKIYTPDFNSVYSNAIEKLSSSQNLYRDLYIISDFQNNLLKEFSESDPLPEGVKLFLINTDIKNFNNLAVKEFELKNKILTKGKKINFTTEIFNSASNKTEGSVASLIINGQRKSQKSFDIEAGKTVLLTFETVLDSDGLVEAFIELEDDIISQDNRRYLSFYVPEKINVLLLRDNPSDTEFLEIVLDESVIAENIRTETKLSSQLNRVRPENYNVIILVGNKNISGSEEINKYLNEGGTLIYFASSNPDLLKVNQFLQTLNGVSSGSILPVTKNVNNVFEKIDFEHVLFSDLFSDSKTTIESPEIRKYLKINTDVNVANIISLIDDSPVLCEIEKGKGKVLLFTISPELSFSNFPVKGIFAPLINKMINYGAMKIRKDNNVIVGDKILINSDRIANNQIKITHPDKTDEFVNIEENYSKSFFEYSKFENPGVYKFYSNNKLIEYFSVNFDPSESELYFISEEEKNIIGKELNPGGFFYNCSINDNIEEIVNKTRFGTELWQYFLITALIIALIEMFISRGVKKDVVVSN